MSELTLDEARRVASAAEAKALELGCAVTITVTDAGGHVRAQTRLDGARFGTLNVSANKAFTAAAFGVPTKLLTGLTQPGQDLFGFADAAGGRSRSLGAGCQSFATKGSSVRLASAAVAWTRTRASPTPGRPRSENAGDWVMKAARLHAYGQLPIVEDVAEPVVSGPLDVVVRVGGAGLCRTDLHVVDGVFAYLATPLPYVLGHEVAGWVHSLGSAVVDLEVGDAVIGHPYVTCGLCGPCRRGDDQFCERFKFAGAMIDGGFAELVATTLDPWVSLALRVRR